MLEAVKDKSRIVTKIDTLLILKLASNCEMGLGYIQVSAVVDNYI